MTTQDTINGLYELFGGMFILLSVRKILSQPKELRNAGGVSLLHPIYFWSWGVWNLYYYSHLNQWASTFAGVAVLAANTWWVVLLWKYNK